MLKNAIFSVIFTLIFVPLAQAERAPKTHPKKAAQSFAAKKARDLKVLKSKERDKIDAEFRKRHEYLKAQRKERRAIARHKQQQDQIKGSHRQLKGSHSGDGANGLRRAAHQKDQTLKVHQLKGSHHEFKGSHSNSGAKGLHRIVKKTQKEDIAHR